MRHDSIGRNGALNYADVEAVWPSGLNTAGPLHELQELVAGPGQAVPDMPVAAGKALVWAYAALIAAFWFTMAAGGAATFFIVICAFYVAIYLAVPAIFLKVEGSGIGRPSLVAFLSRGMVTATGRISGGAALVQMLIVPVLLTFAVLAIGLIAHS